MQSTVKRLVRLGLGLFPVMLVSACVDNPGAFRLTAHAGSFVSIFGYEEEIATTIELGAPACADGIDNDLDGYSDDDDPECVAPADANERLDGYQQYTDTSVVLNIDAAGRITMDPVEIASQEREECADMGGTVGIWCLGVTLTGTGGQQTGTVTSEGALTIPWPVEIELIPLVGFTGLDPNCAIGPITTTLHATTYDSTTGSATLLASDFSVPIAQSCGDPWNSYLNNALGLPANGRVLLNATILDSAGDPIQVS